MIKESCNINEPSSDSLRICVPAPNPYFSMWLDALESDLGSKIRYFGNIQLGGRLLVEPGNYFAACPPYISIILFLLTGFANIGTTSLLQNLNLSYS